MTGTILITGVNRGIGEGIALRCLAGGWSVIGLGRTVPSWADDYRGRFIFHAIDLRDTTRLKALVQSLDTPIDVVLNNAATFGGNAYFAREFEVAALEDAFAINVAAPSIVAAGVRENLLQSRRPLILMMSTGNASLQGNVQGEMFAYRLTKSALNQAVRTMAIEWAADGICVIAVNPGWVRTAMGGDNAPTSVEDCAEGLWNFIQSDLSGLSGQFVNLDHSPLPW